MSFVHPSWIEGALIWLMYFLPFFICLAITIFAGIKFALNTDREKENKYLLIIIVFLILTVVSVPVCEGVGGYLWHESYEVPSITSKVVTVDSWQPKAGLHANDEGMMVISNADQLMLVTSDGEAFLNEENFLFQKFDTRDILNDLKPGSKVNLTYYGWREGFNSGFPNILSAKVIDDSNAENKSIGDYFGTKVV